VLRAIARAHLETGVPINAAHRHGGEIARQQIAILKQEGVKMGASKSTMQRHHRFEIPHLDSGPGLFPGSERYPAAGYPEERTNCLKALIGHGVTPTASASPRLVAGAVLIQAIACGSPASGKNQSLRVFSISKKRFFPKLREMGCRRNPQHLLVNGPRNFFEGNNKKGRELLFSPPFHLNRFFSAFS